MYYHEHHKHYLDWSVEFMVCVYTNKNCKMSVEVQIPELVILVTIRILISLV